MTIDSEGAESCPVSFLLISSLLTEPPDKERVQAFGLDFRGDEGEEFSQLLRIPYGRFVPPFLAVHQNVIAPQDLISKLLSIYLNGGFKFDQSTGERPDHVGVVLEFLAMLESEKKNPTDELLVLISIPIKKFAESLRKATEHPLYLKIADVLDDMGKEMGKKETISNEK